MGQPIRDCFAMEAVTHSRRSEKTCHQLDSCMLFFSPTSQSEPKSLLVVSFCSTICDSCMSRCAVEHLHMRMWDSETYFALTKSDRTPLIKRVLPCVRMHEIDNLETVENTVCLHIHMYVCMNVWLYLYMICILICTYMCVYIYIHINICIYTYICIYMCIYLYMHILRREIRNKRLRTFRLYESTRMVIFSYYGLMICWPKDAEVYIFWNCKKGAESSLSSDREH